VDSEKATKFQFLLDTAGFDHFARIEEAVNVCLDSDDVRTAESGLRVIEKFLSTMEKELQKKITSEEVKDSVKKDYEEMSLWFRHHAENPQVQLCFLEEMFSQHRAVMADGADVQSSTGTEGQDSVTA
jgi:hypothetical protein